MREAIHGAILLGCWAIGVFFFRYWRQSRKRLFRYFGAAFWLLAAERALLLTVSQTNEFHPYIFSVRLVAFLLIIFAIVDENRTPPSG
jgi:uncharacterized membrane protein